MRTVATSLVAMLTLGGCALATEAAPHTQPATSGVRQESSPSPSPGRSEAATASARNRARYAFLHTQPDGTPVAWSSCRPIRFVVRPDHRPPGASLLLAESIDEISGVTGLEFVDEGATDEAPRRDRPLYQPNRYGEQWAPVLIAFSTPREYPPLRGRPAGQGGAAYVETSDAVPRYVSGSVTFDGPQLQRLGVRRTRAVMLHELAHVVGLGHVRDRRQLMHPVQYAGQSASFQDGDVAGLKLLGDAGCPEPLDPTRIGPRLER